MDTKEYSKRALAVERKEHGTVITRLASLQSVSLLHGAIGICTEAGELQDALKRHFFYGKALDPVNVKEELGDLMWYINIVCSELNITLEQVMEANIAKLEKRYEGGFTEQKAINRDTGTERTILENGSSK